MENNADTLKSGLQRADSQEIEEFVSRVRMPENNTITVKGSVGFEDLCGQGKIGMKKQTPSVMKRNLDNERKFDNQLQERTCRNITIAVTIVSIILILFGILLFVSAFVPIFKETTTNWYIVVPFGIILPLCCGITTMSFWMVLNRRRSFKKPIWKGNSALPIV